MTSFGLARARRLILCFVPLAAFGLTQSALAATQWVANSGSDSTVCGDYAAPCRSISQAVENASAGDTIMVRAGRYGDLNKDHDFDDPGEEHPSTVNSCIVCILKPLRFFAESGPVTTVIDGGGPHPNFERVVSIGADNVVFGDDGRGFTITGGFIGLAVSSERSLANVRVAGNLAVNNDSYGFYTNTGAVRYERNTAVNSHVGFACLDLPRITLLTYLNNIAYDNEIVGISACGSRAIVNGNVATRNRGDGFSIGVPNVTVENNTAANNTGSGFRFQASNPFPLEDVPTAVSSFRQNTSIGNEVAGLWAGRHVSFGALEHNNFFGNGTRPTGGIPHNCGLVNLSNARIAAARNYWGRASGPGPDPADAVGGVCDFPPSVTTFSPFQPQQFTILP
jgi:hypothetical protein